MNLQFYLEKLFSSDEYDTFMKENPQAYFCSGFFISDVANKDNQRHIDFYVPDKKEMYSFKVNEVVEKIKVQMTADKIPNEIHKETNFDFSEVQDLIEKEMVKQKVDNKLEK